MLFQSKKWKKGIKNYEVFKNEPGEFVFDKPNANYDIHIGNLFELYNNQSFLKEEPIKLYTSQNSYGKYAFAIGDVYKADEGDIDLDASRCAAGGLHFAAVDYDYSGFGDVSVVVLINPAKTITIPIDECSKGRTTEMKIACINPNSYGVHIEDEFIEKADEEYNEYTLEELKEAISTKCVENLSVQDEITELSIPEVKNISEILKSRIVKV